MDVEFSASSSKPHKPILTANDDTNDALSPDRNLNSNNNDNNSNSNSNSMIIGKKKRRKKVCFGVGISTVLLIVLVVILAKVVFKIKDPEFNIKKVSLEDVDMSVDMFHMKVNLNVSLDISASVKNPNKAGFKFANTSLIISYRAQPVVNVPVPASKISAGGTLPINTTVTVYADRIVSNYTQLFEDVVVAGSLPLSTYTSISGKVSLLGFIKFHVRVTSYCDIVVFISNRTIGDQHCRNKAKL